MRLTLRTLIAYMDNVLDEEDAAELKAKIDSSEFAGNLVHRIQGAVRRLRLDVPRLDARGVGLELNSVAEYLDNTLPPEKVADFERVCLDSDIQLAEVAACHQILTMVEGQEADVGPDTRNRIYHLGHGEFDGPANKSEGAPQLAAATSADELADHEQVDGANAVTTPDRRQAERQRPEVPSHLLPVTRKHRLKRVLLVAAAAFLLTAAGLRSLGPFNAEHPVATWLQGMQTSAVAQNDPSNDDPSSPTPSPTNSSDSVQDAAQGPNQLAIDQSEADMVPEVLPLVEPVEGPVPQLNAGQSLPLAPEDDLADLAVDSVPDIAPPEDPADTPDEIVQANVPGDTVPTIEEEGTPLPLIGQDDPVDLANNNDSEAPTDPLLEPGNLVDVSPQDPPVPSLQNPVANTGDGNAASVSPVRPTDNALAVNDAVPNRVEADSNPQPAKRSEPRDIGRYISMDHVLLSTENGQQWHRLAPRAALEMNTSLLALPAFQPQLMLASGIQVTLDGGSQLLVSETPEQATLLRIRYGRALLATVGRDETGIALDFESHQAMLVFADANSAVAVEVNRLATPETDPTANPSRIVIRAFPTSGSIQWHVDGQEPIEVQAGQVLIIVDQNQPVLGNAESTPDWIDGKNISNIDRRAGRTIEAAFENDRSVTLVLQELVDHRAREVRSLAARGLTYLENYDASIKLLNDASQYSFWSKQIEALNEGISRGPDSATQVKASLERAHGPEGRSLFGMMQGYTPKQLKTGADELLVDSLSHPSLVHRVLAFENLKKITRATLRYRPERPETSRRQPIASWRMRLKKGEIEYKQLPLELQLLTPETP